ncbi:c-type cytochrome [Pontibacter vulgaris]|uniref:c-type cytochrome n=1 Tax=Pontibacter vulgaris TaxID=2905679 RepID=UPI001FA80E46|nr:c-type cytochrome [Pontibacter vulgaris]
MLNHVFGNTTGIKITYFSLFSCFLLFTGFIYTSEVPQTILKNEQHELAVKGKQLWQKHNCVACHQFYGLGGYIGPDVTNVLSATGKGEPYVRAILQNGTATMPDFKLQQHEIDALVGFLKEADATGKSGREHFSIDATGQIQNTPQTNIKP